MYLRLPLAAGLFALLLAACDGSGAGTVISDGPTDPAGVTCPVDTPDCVDTVFEPSPDGEGVDEHAAIAEAEGLIGVARDDLDPSVRISRMGDEQLAVTEDYVIGRITVELDPDADGVLRVVSATVELTEGPVTVTA